MPDVFQTSPSLRLRFGGTDFSLGVDSRRSIGANGCSEPRRRRISFICRLEPAGDDQVKLRRGCSSRRILKHAGRISAVRRRPTRDGRFRIGEPPVEEDGPVAVGNRWGEFALFNYRGRLCLTRRVQMSRNRLVNGV